MSAKISPHLPRALFAAAQLPRTEPLRIAAAYRFDRLRTACGDDTHEMARALRISVRQVQRLRVAFGVARPPGSSPDANPGRSR